MSSVAVSDEDGAFDESVQSYSLPKGLIKIEITTDKTSAKSTVGVVAETIADSRYRFRVQYKSNWLSSDAITFKTDDQGLLKTIWSKVQDRTYQVAVNLARSIGAVQGFTVPSAANYADSQRCAAQTIPEDVEKLYLDPYASEKHPKWISIEDPSGDVVTRPSLTAEKLKACNRGVCTRAMRPWLIKVNIDCKKVDGKDDLKQRHEIIYLPDERDLVVVDLDRAFMVEKRFYAIFNKGMLSEVRLSRGSSAEELAKLPEAILKSLVSVPKELVELRYNYSEARKDLAGSELESLKRQDALIDYWRQRAKKAEAPATPSPPAAGAPEPAPGQPPAPGPRKPEAPVPESPPPSTAVGEPTAPEEPPAVPDEPPPPELFDDVTPAPGT